MQVSELDVYKLKYRADVLCVFFMELCRHEINYSFAELGTQQTFSFTTTTARQRNRASGTRKNAKNSNVLVSTTNIVMLQ